MVFQIPEPGGSKPENRFEFELKSKTYSIPKAEYLSSDASKFLEDMSTGKISDVGFTEYIRILFFKAEPKLPKALFEGLSRDQLTALRDAWYAASKVTTGESSASESS
ncbi:hypothetical protein OG874_00555 [Nocardia sp. NBC_00565]|uniref:hypothetical protein n=1 Tax=Nocardia sp. NBC_00565 TaxID=2975993 RepID=UPI002E8208D2|nr:hypothetical protein [Nocardia sp. NBC_00565]WUC03746.1 hypothetical protein OG874_00555 [Nocardia sp. NBC_00565]